MCRMAQHYNAIRLPYVFRPFPPDAAAQRTEASHACFKLPLRLHNDRITDTDGVVVPGGIVGAQIDTSVTDVCVALRIHRPRCRMHVDAARGYPLGVLCCYSIALRGIQRNADGPRLHHDASILFKNAEASDRRWTAGLAH